MSPYGGGGTKRPFNTLGQLVLRLSFSSSGSSGDVRGLPEAARLQRPGASYRSALEGAAVVPAAPAVVPPSSPPQPGRHRGAWLPSVGDVLRLSRLEFLQACLSSSLPSRVAEDVLAGSRPSTIRQYQSAWKALQLYLRNRPVTTISLSVVLDFLSYMFHARRRAAPTITTYAAALADPLWFGFSLDVRGRLWDLMKRSFFLQRPPPRQRTIF